MGDRPAVILQEGRHLAEQRQAVGVAPALVGVGEVLPDVAEAGCAQQRVDDRVGQDVSVGVAGQPQLGLDLDPAEHQSAPRFQTM